MSYTGWRKQEPQTGITGAVLGTSLPAGNAVTIAVTFPWSFTVAPVVVMSMANAPSGSAYLSPRALAITKDGFTAYFYNTGSAAQTFSGVTASWIAQPQ